METTAEVVGPSEGAQLAGCRSYLQLGLKSSWVWGFFSFKVIISWSSRRKGSRLTWFRNVRRSFACFGLRPALYLALISRNGSCSEVRADEARSRGQCGSLCQADGRCGTYLSQPQQLLRLVSGQELPEGNGVP